MRREAKEEEREERVRGLGKKRNSLYRFPLERSSLNGVLARAGPIRHKTSSHLHFSFLLHFAVHEQGCKSQRNGKQRKINK